MGKISLHTPTKEGLICRLTPICKKYSVFGKMVSYNEVSPLTNPSGSDSGHKEKDIQLIFLLLFSTVFRVQRDAQAPHTHLSYARLIPIEFIHQMPSLATHPFISEPSDT